MSLIVHIELTDQIYNKNRLENLCYFNSDDFNSILYVLTISIVLILNLLMVVALILMQMSKIKHRFAGSPREESIQLEDFNVQFEP